MKLPANAPAPAIFFTRGWHRFEVHCTNSEGMVRYLGFYDGRILAEGTECHLVTRALLELSEVRSEQ